MPGCFQAVNQRRSGALGMIDSGGGREASLIADKPAVHRSTLAGHDLEQLPVSGGRGDVASQRAALTDRGTHVVVPVAGAEAGGTVGEDPGGANIHQLSLIHISEPTRRTPISY